MRDARHDTRGASSTLGRDNYRVFFFACVIFDQSVRKHAHTPRHQWDRPLALVCTTWKTTLGASLVAVATRDAFGMAMAFDFAASETWRYPISAVSGVNGTRSDRLANPAGQLQPAHAACTLRSYRHICAAGGAGVSTVAILSSGSGSPSTTLIGPLDTIQPPYQSFASA